MSNKCGKCGKFASTDDARCTKCKDLYHKTCVSPKSRIGPSWLCKVCKNKPEKVNKPMPDNSPGDVYEDAGSIQPGQSILADEIKLLRTELSGFRNEMSKLANIVSEFTSRLDIIEDKVLKLESQNKQIVELNSSINLLQKRLNESEQRNLINDVEITGLPESNGENPTHIVISLAKKIGICLEETDIVSAERSGSTRVPQNESQDRVRARAMVVRFTRRHLRDEMLRAARVRRATDTAGTGIAGAPHRFYINERLTSINRRLFYLARQEGSAKKWRYVWTRGGYIYARKEPQSKAYRIHSDDDLKSVFGSETVC
ncbi:unnamed protein product [Colias eurytheme]|nr:unnamed protein product [Colias eurytheme]